MCIRDSSSPVYVRLGTFPHLRATHGAGCGAPRRGTPRAASASGVRAGGPGRVPPSGRSSSGIPSPRVSRTAHQPTAGRPAAGRSDARETLRANIRRSIREPAPTSGPLIQRKTPAVGVFTGWPGRRKGAAVHTFFPDVGAAAPPPSRRSCGGGGGRSRAPRLRTTVASAPFRSLSARQVTGRHHTSSSHVSVGSVPDVSARDAVCVHGGTGAPAPCMAGPTAPVRTGAQGPCRQKYKARWWR